MINAVLLCDTDWKITRIRQCNPEWFLQEEDFLTDFVSEKEKLQNDPGNRYVTELTISGQNRSMPVLIDSFKEGNLVIIAQVSSNADFIELANAYTEHVEWAKIHLQGLYHDEYFMIQQMNNQLVDAQRRLTRSNHQLEAALKENKEINEKLEEAKELAERASFSKSRFLAHMSHDIRTPLNAIVGLSELMQYQLSNPEILKNYIYKLRSSSKYLLDLINDILDFSKIENDSLELNIEPMDIGVQIDQILTIIRPQIEQKNQNLSVQSEISECSCILGDAVRFQQILMNLFSNAMKYTPEGGEIQFYISEMNSNGSERAYRFVVQDNGIGMEPEFAAHIFEPFTRAGAAVSGIQGTGLGMTITKNIVDAMNGSIQVASRPGKGSRFTVDLSFPLSLPSDGAGTGPAGEAGAGSAEDPVVDLSGMRLLCAEDNELNTEILETILQMKGASCTVYPNGALLVEAFEREGQETYDAILMDIQMPVMDGYEAAERIRNSSNPRGKTIPIIAMTANAFAEDVQHCLKVGMDAHIAKPIEIKTLQRTLGRILTLHREKASKPVKK